MGFVNRTNQNVAKYRIGIRMKKWWWSRLVDVALQSMWVLYRINKDEGDESLPLLAFRRNAASAIFLENSKGRLSSSHVGIPNIPSDVFYDDTKHYY